ncbi:MAG: hypothetical protein K8T20_08195 [Planctomycetes bacterium]|nr:hypothetical protein [Planctomycetota bacterium]
MRTLWIIALMSAAGCTSRQARLEQATRVLRGDLSPGPDPQLDQCIQKLSSLIQEEPDWAPAYNDRALARLWAEDARGARDDCDTYFRLSGALGPGLRSIRSKASWVLGDLVGAQADLEAENDPDGRYRSREELIEVLICRRNWVKVVSVAHELPSRTLRQRDLLVWIARSKMGDRADASRELREISAGNHSGCWRYLPEDARSILLEEAHDKESILSGKVEDDIVRSYFLGMKLSLDGRVAEATELLTHCRKSRNWDEFRLLAEAELTALSGK